MAKAKSEFDPYKRPPSADRYAKKYGGGDGLELHAKQNSPANQDPIDKPGPGYSNDTRERWLVGRGKPHPNFDYGPSGSRYGKGK